MAKINFSKITVKDLDGKDLNYDIHRDFSNLLYMQGRSIEEHELGRKIYNSRDEKGIPTEVELNKDETKIVLQYIKGYPYILAQKVEEILKDAE